MKPSFIDSISDFIKADFKNPLGEEATLSG
jgi:hypothetical protein